MYVCIAYPSVVLRILIFVSSDDMYLFAIICLFDIHSYVSEYSLGNLDSFTPFRPKGCSAAPFEGCGACARALQSTTA